MVKGKGAAHHSVAVKIKNHRAVLVGIAVAAVLFLLASGVWWRQANANNQCRNTGQSPLYGEMASALQSRQNDTMERAVERVKKNKHYLGDPNCVYGLVGYYIFIKDLPNAEASYKQLITVFSKAKNDKLATPYHESGVITLQDVTDQMELLRQERGNFSTSTVYF